MRILLLLAAMLLLAHPALAQNPNKVVPCSAISPQAVTTVPAPFNADMELVCFNTSGQGLMPPKGTQWVDGNIAVGLTAMDDRPGPDGKARLSIGWYVVLTPRQIPPDKAAKLRHLLAQAVRPEFINGAKISELEAVTAAGQVKQEFWITPADPAATHGIRLIMECHDFCQGDDKPWILGVIPDATN